MSRLHDILDDLRAELERLGIRADVGLWPDTLGESSCLPLVDWMGGKRKRTIYLPVDDGRPYVIEASKAAVYGGRLTLSAQFSTPATEAEIADAEAQNPGRHFFEYHATEVK